MSEYVTIVEATDYGDTEKTIHPINKVLQAYKGKKLSVFEILAKDSGCHIIPKYNFIINSAGRMILPGQIFESYGIMNGNVRCTICTDVFDWNNILVHLQDDFQKGHHLSTEKTIKLFAREFYAWETKRTLGKPGYTYRGSDIKF